MQLASLPLLLAQAETTDQSNPAASLAGAVVGMVVLAIYLVLILIIVIGMWKVFTKAGKPGWASIVPFYNAIVLLEISGRPAWWLILFFIPFVNFVMAIIVMIDLAKSFGKGGGYGIGLAFLPFIFFPMLGFGNSRYVGPVALQAPLASAV